MRSKNVLTAQDLHGVVAMMPAFATADAGDIRATATVDVDNLTDQHPPHRGRRGQRYRDHRELRRVPHAAGRGVRHPRSGHGGGGPGKRVPVIIGCTSLNNREAVRKITVARDAGADGVLVGVPFYFPSTVDNAVRFYHDVAELLPDLAFMIYHNPTLRECRSRSTPSAASRRARTSWR